MKNSQLYPSSYKDSGKNTWSDIMQTVDDNLLQSAQDLWLGWLSATCEISSELAMEWVSHNFSSAKNDE